MVAVYDNWERLVQATLRREELRISGLRTPSDVSLASSSSSISFSFSSSSRPPLSSFEFSGRLVGDLFSYQQILEATDYLSSKNLIKHGCHGDLFYGVLEGGTQVLVKKVDLSSMEKESYLRSELQFFNKVSHFRFVPLLGHCLENWSEKFLVYEYMPGKDLSSSLNREKDSPSPLLDWKTRLRIATGAAEGLCYLHHECVPPLVHRGSEQGTSDTSKETRAYDVYCFGKVLLELVTGKKNFSADNDSSTRDWMANSLPYITPYDRGLCVNILDPSLFTDTMINPSLIRDEHLLLEVSAVAVVAKACLSAEPSKRLQMTYILEALQDPKSVRFSAHGRPQSGAQGPALAKTRVPKGYKLAGTSVATTRAKFSGNNTASLSHQFSAAGWEDESHLNKEIEDLSDLRIYSFSELKAATRNFRKDGILGEGGFGRVYKGWISTSKSGTKSPIAVKRVKHERMTEFHEWQNEIDIPGKLSHPNLIKLLGYCWENEELMLVYEFMQKGSLDNHLFGRGSNIQPLPWDIRLKILIGVARGLAFLHASKKQVIHRDIRSSNIFLDGSSNAKISGFLLARPGPSDGDTHVTTHVMGICGYAAPEYVATGHLYVKSDVYSFGVIMIEVLTGLRTLDLNRPVGQHYLADWIKPHLSDKRKLQSILDTKLQGKYPIKATVKMAQLALTCLSPEPKARPSMKEVVDALENIKSANDKPKESRTVLTR